MENKSGAERKFVLNVLPWIIGAAAFAVYLITLNPWVSFFNTSAVARLSGWQWYPEISRVAFYIATLPFQWLPPRHIPLALNLFSATCAALAIGQFARCVALLPFDRTLEQRLREQSSNSLLSLPLAWIPPVVASIALTLQITLWDHATTGSAFPLNLLIFSYIVRTLLEYRQDGRESRLPRLAFVYGIGMANDTSLVSYFPLFLLSLLWLRRIAFFNFRFLLRMAFCGLAGLTLLLLLPYLASRSNVQAIDFWPGLKVYLLTQKALLIQFPKKTLIVLALTSLAPVFLFSIRWAAGFGDNSQLGTALSTFVLHLIHFVFLLACVWTVFDSPFSPYVRGFGFPFLSFYFLAALSIGYFCGYFLLVFRKVPSEKTPVIQQGLNCLAHAMIIGLLIALPIGLIAKNLGQIRTSNGPLLKQYAASLTAELPNKGILLSDDMYHLIFAQSWLLLHDREKDFLPLDTRWLTMPGYHRYLRTKYSIQLPEAKEEHREKRYAASEEIRLLLNLAETNEVYYLHPSFGYFFEFFYQEPAGLVYRLARYQTNAILQPPLSMELVSKNEKFWTLTAQDNFAPILAVTKPKPIDNPDLSARIWKLMRVQNEPNHTAVALGGYYSRPLNYWGAEMQKRRELSQASNHFQLALNLKPDNVVAEINLECNRQLASNTVPEVTLNRSVEDLFGKYRSWDEVLSQNGPYDEPSFCYAASYHFSRVRMFRQAAQMVDRVRAFSPNNLTMQLMLAQICLISRMPENVLAYTAEIRTNAQRFKLTSTNLLDIATLEGAAYLLRKDTQLGTQMLESVADSRTNNPRSLDTLFAIYNNYGLYTNALGILDRQLKMNSEDVEALVNKGYIYSKLKAYDKAIPPLTQALNIDTNNTKAMFNRAVAYLCNSELDQARSDYEQLQALYPGSYRIYFGLAEIAVMKKDTNTAIQYYEAYLTNALPEAPETKVVEKRLNDLKGVKEPKPEKPK